MDTLKMKYLAQWRYVDEFEETHHYFMAYWPKWACSFGNNVSRKVAVGCSICR